MKAVRQAAAMGYNINKHCGVSFSSEYQEAISYKILRYSLIFIMGATVAERLDCSPLFQGEPGSVPGRVTPRLSQVGIVPDDADGRWVFSEISRLPRPRLSELLHCHFISPSSALKTLLYMKHKSYFSVNFGGLGTRATCCRKDPGSVRGSPVLILNKGHRNIFPTSDFPSTMFDFNGLADDKSWSLEACISARVTWKKTTSATSIVLISASRGATWTGLLAGRGDSRLLCSATWASIPATAAMVTLQLGPGNSSSAARDDKLQIPENQAFNKTLVHFWLRVAFIAGAFEAGVLAARYLPVKTSKSLDCTDCRQVLYSEQVRGYPRRRQVTLKCELFGLAGHYALVLRSAIPTLVPVLGNDSTPAYLKVSPNCAVQCQLQQKTECEVCQAFVLCASVQYSPIPQQQNCQVTWLTLIKELAVWSDKFIFNVHARSIFPCDVLNGGVPVLFEYPACILESGDRVRLFARLRADVTSLAPPTSLRYVAERGVARGAHSLHFDCDLFSERYVEYCFVYVNKAVTGAVTDVRMDCVPTLPVAAPLLQISFSQYRTTTETRRALHVGVIRRYEYVLVSAPITSSHLGLGRAAVLPPRSFVTYETFLTETAFVFVLLSLRTCSSVGRLPLPETQSAPKGKWRRFPVLGIIAGPLPPSSSRPLTLSLPLRSSPPPHQSGVLNGEQAPGYKPSIMAPHERKNSEYMRNTGRPQSVRTVRLEEVIRHHINHVPSTSTLSIARQTGVSHSTVWDVLWVNRSSIPTAGGKYEAFSENAFSEHSFHRLTSLNIPFRYTSDVPQYFCSTPASWKGYLFPVPLSGTERHESEVA
ncbi:hypothetical protein PR048_014980 [Dryococelus australis]|uniref:Uncharacterized protein n=1 Tax=Dryococelus australis TaxID=614101 RepID=A0ABQ9HFN0_9NEOP|nr:hypothetical protein PR048_014980 [Dryococelus australis]